MKKYILLLVIICFLSCNTETGNNDKILIDLSSGISRSENLNEEIKNIDFIQIDNSIPIDQIDNLRFYKDRYFFLHKGGRYSSDVYGIVCVNTRGELLWNYDKKGKGPGEFTNVFFMDFLKYREEVVFYDYDSGKLNFLDINGNFIRSLKVDSDPRITAIKELPNGQLLAVLNKGSSRITDEVILKHDLIFIDEKGKATEKFLPNTNNAMGWYNRGENLLPGKNQLLYSNTLQSTIFEVNQEGLDSMWKLDFGEFNPDTARYFHPKSHEDWLMSGDPKEVISFKLIHSPRNLWLIIPHNMENLHVAIVNKKNKQVTYYENPGNSDFYFNGIPVPLYSLTQNGESFVYSISAIKALEYWDKLTDEDKAASDPEWKVKMEDLEPDDNPIICKLFAK